MRSILNKLGCSYMVKRVAGFLFFSSGPLRFGQNVRTFFKKFRAGTLNFLRVIGYFWGNLAKGKTSSIGPYSDFSGSDWRPKFPRYITCRFPACFRWNGCRSSRLRSRIEIQTYEHSGVGCPAGKQKQQFATASSHLKTDGWKMSFLLGASKGLFSGANC